MRRAVFSALAAVMLSAGPALADTDFPAAISVTGEANISVAPDLAQIDGGVASEAMTKVLQALKGAGIGEKDVQTSHLSLQPQYASSAPSRPGPSVIVGYRASNRVTIKLRDVTKLAGIIDTLVSAGANEIGGINFTVSQASKLLDEARERAVADARRKAEIYAKAAGVTLGAPLSISEAGAPVVPLFRGKAMPMAAATPVAQGEET